MSQFLSKYSPADYQYQKIIGHRKNTGELRLKRLKAVHRQMIAYHLRGMSNRDIASVTGFAENAISRVLRDPLSQVYIQEHLQNTELELGGLSSLAVDALRDGLCSSDLSIALQAVDKYYKATGRYAKASDGGETAEDAMARMLARIAENQSDAINVLARGNHAKVLDMPKRQIEKPPLDVIDGDKET